MVAQRCTVDTASVTLVLGDWGTRNSTIGEVFSIARGDLLGGFGSGLIDRVAKLQRSGSCASRGLGRRLIRNSSIGGSLTRILDAWVARMEGLQTAGSIKQNAEMTCERRRECCWTLFRVNLPRLESALAMCTAG